MTIPYYTYKPRGLQPFDDKLASVRDLNQMEDRIMSALTDALNNLRSAVDGVTSRFNTDRVLELERLIAEERAAEAAEDVEQERQLNEARAATDAVLSELNTAAGEIQSLSDHLNVLGTAATDGTPTTADAAPVPGTPTPGQNTAQDAVPVPVDADTSPDDAAASADTPTEPPPTPTDTTGGGDTAPDTTGAAATENATGDTATEGTAGGDTATGTDGGGDTATDNPTDAPSSTTRDTVADASDVPEDEEAPPTT